MQCFEGSTFDCDTAYDVLLFVYYACRSGTQKKKKKKVKFKGRVTVGFGTFFGYD